jgi:radical SAM protein with 4Fe4S-binding SPASM domain
MFNTVVSVDTYLGVSEVIRKACEVGFDAVNLIRLARNTPAVHRVPLDVEEDLFPEWHRLGEDIGIEVRSTYTQRDEEWHYCPLWANYIYINLYGDVTPCCHLPERAFAVGNLLRQDLDDIWHGKKLRKFWSMQFPEVCADCTLMTWHSPREQKAKMRAAGTD